MHNDFLLKVFFHGYKIKSIMFGLLKTFNHLFYQFIIYY